MMATPCLAQKIAPFSGLRAHGSQAVRVPEMGENAWHFFMVQGGSHDRWNALGQETERHSACVDQIICGGTSYLCDNCRSHLYY
jgi:hypothetical protein